MIRWSDGVLGDGDGSDTIGAHDVDDAVGTVVGRDGEIATRVRVGGRGGGSRDGRDRWDGSVRVVVKLEADCNIDGVVVRRKTWQMDSQ